MAKITDYLTVKGVDDSSLIKEVNKKIKEEWQPFGGIAVQVLSPKQVVMIQAMVKYEN